MSLEKKDGDLSISCRYLYRNRFTAGPDFTINSHSHLFWHVEYVKKGTLIATVDDSVFTLGPGDSVLLPPEKPHSFLYKDFGTTVFSIKFEADSPWLEQLPVCKTNNIEMSALFEALDAMLIVQKEPPVSIAAAVNHIISALIHLFLNTESVEQVPPEKKLSASIKNVIKKRDGKPVTIRDIALKLGYSISYIRTEFRKQENMALKEYIDRQRAIIAAQYLAYSDMPIKEIVSIMEFPDPQCFTRFCKRLTGRNPLMIRKQIRIGDNIDFHNELYKKHKNTHSD